MSSPWDNISLGDEQDALHSITKMLTGTKMLADEPGVVYSLAAQQAHPADAQAIDQFMQALDAEKQVNIARTTGEKVNLSPTQQAQLQANGVQFNDVLFTEKDATQAAINHIQQASKGQYTAKTNADGTLALDKNGNIQTVAHDPALSKDASFDQALRTAENGGAKIGGSGNDDSGVFGAIGGFLGHVGHDIKNWTVDTGQGLGKAWNFVQSSVAPNGFSNPLDPNSSDITQQILKNTDTQDMEQQGYDPTSIWSTLAFNASGRKHTSLANLNDTFGQEKVDEALKFLSSPEQYRKSIETDPASWTKTVDGRPDLTAEAKAKLTYLASPDFEELTKRVNAHQATVGNDLANALGLDPTKDSVVPGAGLSYNSVASTTNVVAAFALDPTLLALKAAQVAKLSQIGIDTLADADGAAKVLTNTGRSARAVQRGWQQAIDLADQMRTADAAGDTVAKAKLTAQFQASLPGLAPLMDDFVGKYALKGWRNPTDAELTAGQRAAIPIMGETGGIRSLEDAAAFIQQKWGMTRLMNGRAATQSSLMPGALSAFGVRKVKGLTSGWMTERSLNRSLDAQAEVISRAEANPALAQSLIDDGTLMKLPAQPDDAVDVYTHKVIAYRPADTAHDAVGNLMGALREGGPVASERAALSDELDALEERMQSLNADKTADPAELAHVQDSIQTGRQLLDMVDQGLAPVTKDIKAAQEKLKQAEAILPRVTVPGEQAAADSIGLRVETTKTTKLMPSQQRAQYAVTDAGKGEVARNLRSTGDPLADSSRVGLFSPTAIAARSRLAAQRFSTLLPRNTELAIDDARSADTLYKFALTYLNRGDANALRSAWTLGDGGQRKAIISGLIDQVGHAAGLGKTQTGKLILDRAKTAEENYSAAGSEIELDGQKIAPFEGQTNDRWMLPTFQAMQQASAKFGLWEATMGRALTSEHADTLMSQWKMGALFKPSTVTRNQLEGWLRTILDGKAGDAIKAKAVATARNKELWDQGYGLEDREAFLLHRKEVGRIDAQLGTKGFTREQRTQMYAERRTAKAAMDALHDRPIVQHLLATEAGDAKLAKQIENGSMLSGDVLGRSTVGHRLANLGPLAFAGRAYRALVGTQMDSATVEALLTLSPQELTEAMEGYGQQLLANELGFKRAANEVTEAAQAGWGASKIRWTVSRALERGAKGKGAADHTVWTHEALDGTEGADRYATALAQRVNAQPATARAALDVLENKGTLDDVVAALESEKKHTAFGSVYFEDPITAPNVARRAVTDDEVALGKRDWAQKVVDEYTYLLKGRNDVYQQELADYIRERGVAPDGGWVADHLTGDNRPVSALAPQTMAQPAGGIRSLAQSLQDIEGGAYQWLVERPLQRTTSSPVFLANYAIARKGLNPQVEQMVEAGIDRGAAEALAKELSIKNAWVKTEQLIDDPGQKTQFDVIARNMFPFARATNAMIRRWGTGLWQNPVAARKMMLAYEGAQHAGLIYNNAYGEPTFTYPASGVLNMATRELSRIPGFGGSDGVQFPIASDMTGGVLMSVPGADNPFRMSMGPMLSMPLRYVYKNFLPTSWRGDALKVDEFINGPVGAGETLPQLVPTVVRNFYKNMVASDQNSALASSMNGAFANLAAAGLVPPPDASPADLQKFRTRLQTQVHNQLFARAVFGLFAPAAPSQPTEGTAKSGADFAWSIDGIQQLSDEYKSILNEVGGDVAQANAVFTTLHPDEVIYKTVAGKSETKLTASAMTEARSAASATGAYLPATDSALQWMTTHEGFIKDYSSVAAYFLPAPKGNEPFSDAAYKAQIELGLRQKKTPEQFMNDIYVKHAESTFYPTVSEWDRRINDAKAAGNDSLATQLSADKSAWEKEYKALNPMFGAKMRNYADTRTTAIGQLADLKEMLAKGDVPDGQATKLQQLITTWDNYNAFVTAHRGSDATTKAQHAAALDIFNKWALENLDGTPLADVFNGVFRPLNTNLTKLTTGG